MADQRQNQRLGPPVPFTIEEQIARTRQWEVESNRIVEMRADLDAAFPDLPVATLDLFMASLVIANNLGEDWVASHIDPSGTKAGPRPFLRTSPVDSFERHERYVRIMELGRRIFELGQERFADRLLTNLRRRDLEGAAFEADVVRMLVAAPVMLSLRGEHGTKGDDYDIDVWLNPVRPLAVEVKTRSEDAAYSNRALARTLDRARTQLPSGGLGAIFLKIPTPWLGLGDYRRNHPDVIERFLRSTSRVQLIVLTWDGWKPRTFGSGFVWERRSSIFRSDDIDESLSMTFDLYEVAWSSSFDIGPRAPF